MEHLRTDPPFLAGREFEERMERRSNDGRSSDPVNLNLIGKRQGSFNQITTCYDT